MITSYFLYFFSILLPLALWVATSIWVIYDAEKIPDEGWRTVRESKNVWIALSILLAWPFGLIIYLILVRRPLEKFLKQAEEDAIIERYKARSENTSEPTKTKAEENSYAKGLDRTETLSTVKANPKVYANSNLRRTMESMESSREDESDKTEVLKVHETGPLASIPVVYPPVPAPEKAPTVQKPDVDDDLITSESENKDEEEYEVSNVDHPPIPSHKPTVQNNLVEEDDNDSSDIDPSEVTDNKK